MVRSLHASGPFIAALIAASQAASLRAVSEEEEAARRKTPPDKEIESPAETIRQLQLAHPVVETRQMRRHRERREAKALKSFKRQMERKHRQ